MLFFPEVSFYTSINREQMIKRNNLSSFGDCRDFGLRAQKSATWPPDDENQQGRSGCVLVRSLSHARPACAKTRLARVPSLGRKSGPRCKSYVLYISVGCFILFVYRQRLSPCEISCLRKFLYVFIYVWVLVGSIFLGSRY